MSLINDALKRASAKSTARPANPDLPQGVPVLQPAPDQKPALTVPVLGLILLAALLIIAFFFMRSKEPVQQASATTAQPGAAPASSPPATALPKAAAPTPEAPAASQTTPAANAVLNPLQRAAAVANKISAQNDEGVAAAQSISTPAAAPPAPIAAPVRTAPPVEQAPAPPSFKLQAIFYRLNNPTAVINGKTVRQGESVSGAKVLAIQRNAVELDLNGHRQTLSLK